MKPTIPHSAIAYGAVALYATLTIALPAQTYTTLHNFNSHYGASPAAVLVQALNGDLYGTTVNGGAYGNPYGTVFRITPAGAFASLYSFCSLSGCTDGTNPSAGLVQASNGDLYGTAQTGGTNLNASGNGAGNIFRITPGGALTTVYDFCALSGCTDGDGPQAGLIQGVQWRLLRDHLQRRGELRPLRLRDSLQNHPEWYADDALQLLFRQRMHRRRIPAGRAGPSHQRRFLRDNRGWRGSRQLWDGL